VRPISPNAFAFNQRQLRSDLKPRDDFIVCGSGFRQHLCSLSLRECSRRIPPEAFIFGGTMNSEPRQELTLILGRAQTGDERAREDLIALVYDELRRVASRLMRRERTDHTLSPTAVVHEAVIRLLGGAAFDKAADRNFLIASAARAMREVLIDHARTKASLRRGGGRRRVPLDLVVDYFEEQGVDVVAVHEALDRLAELNERQSQVMTLRYFGGMTVPETALALGVSVVTVERDWRLARAWLAGQLRGTG
jgi:RNA polymerase sigma-70 factor, ECF subfamily